MVINDNEDALPLTPEQIGLRVAELQKEKAVLDAARSKEETRRIEAQQAIQAVNAEETLRQSIATTGVTYYPEPGELKMILTSMGFLFTASTRGDQIRVVTPEGKTATLEAALERLAVEKPHLCDYETTRHLRPRTDQGQYAELSRDQFATVASKSRWISEHSLAEWEAMPQHRAPKTPAHLITAAEYSRLPISAKSKMIGEVGPEGIEEIMRRR